VTDKESPLLELLARVASSQVLVTLRELFLHFGVLDQWSDLDKVSEVDALCKKYNLEVLPGLDRGDLDSLRRLRFRTAAEFTFQSALREIAQGESQNLEFKSSLLFDRKRAEIDPNAKTSDLKSEAVLHSTLRSVAALMNTDGGLLYVGVRDDGEPVGIECDYLFLKPDKRGPDSWELLLRDSIKDRFYRGNSVNDFAEAKFVPTNDVSCTIVRVEVAPRPELSFLRSPGEKGYRLYRRQGNRTTEVPIEEFQDFLSSRKQGDSQSI
jgi:hypothetical protein